MLYRVSISFVYGKIPGWGETLGFNNQYSVLVGNNEYVKGICYSNIWTKYGTVHLKTP